MNSIRYRTLYLCYFPLREPLVQTQVLPYLRQLTRDGHRALLLTFEAERMERAIERDWHTALAADGIDWQHLKYHKKPSLLATIYDILIGGLRASMLVRQHQVPVIHGRSHVPTAMAFLARRLTGARVVFDIRGLMADEYVDSGNWAAGSLKYRLTKRAERALIAGADAHVVLTDRLRRELFPNGTAGSIAVIPCCTSTAAFTRAASERDRVRAEIGAAGRTVIVYAGSLGGAYLTRELAQFLASAREQDPSVFALILSQSNPRPMAEELERLGFGPGDRLLSFVPPDVLPRYLAAADMAVSMLLPTYSKIAMSPTKFAEYLAAGLPVMAPSGIGDLDGQIEQERVGVLFRGLDPDAFTNAFAEMRELRKDPQLRDRCIEVARKLYDLDQVGGVRYRSLYRALEESVRPSLKVFAVATYPESAAATRHRVLQFVAPLANRGIQVRFSPFLNEPLFANLYRPAKMLRMLPRLLLQVLMRGVQLVRASRSDVLFVQREAALFGPPVFEWVVVRLLHKPMILDLDDATYLSYTSPVYGRLATFLKASRKTAALLRWAAHVVAGSPVVAEYARRLGKSTSVLPTIVDVGKVHPGVRTPSHVPVLGWIGTHGTYKLLETIFPVLERLVQSHPFRLRLIGSGRSAVSIRGVDVETSPWCRESELADMQSFDIGLYPLIDDAWNAGKSGFKAIQYLSLGLPFVMSPVGICETLGVAGRTHLLARTEEEWLAALRRLIEDEPLRESMGREGREYAVKEFSIDKHADELARVLRSASAERAIP